MYYFAFCFFMIISGKWLGYSRLAFMPFPGFFFYYDRQLIVCVVLYNL